MSWSYWDVLSMEIWWVVEIEEYVCSKLDMAIGDKEINAGGLNFEGI